MKIGRATALNETLAHKKVLLFITSLLVLPIIVERVLKINYIILINYITINYISPAILTNLVSANLRFMKNDIKALQLKILRIQQGIFHKKERLILVFEGFDAAGKGGAIRKITEPLDPRGYRVHPIGPPGEKEQGRHYLYRFWKRIPRKSMIAIFDRSWYGRVLVERVEKLTPKERWKMAYSEINQFEKVLTDDGVIIIKFFLKITKGEQLKRFEARLKDPYKRWKITKEDIKNRSKWDKYVEAAEDMILETSTEHCPWHVIATDNKDEAREQVLRIITNKCSGIGKWMVDEAYILNTKELKKSLEAFS